MSLTISLFTPDTDMNAVVEAKVRPEDEQELQSSRGMGFLQFMETMCNTPEVLADAQVIKNSEGQLIAIGGLVTSADNVGIPWFIATDRIEQHPIETYKIMKAMLAIWKKHTKALLNWVDIRNHRAIRFIDSLGFKWVKGDHCFFFEMGGTYFQAFVMKGDMSNV